MRGGGNNGGCMVVEMQGPRMNPVTPEIPKTTNRSQSESKSQTGPDHPWEFPNRGENVDAARQSQTCSFADQL